MKKLSFILFVIVFISCKNGKNNIDASGMFEATEIIVSAEGNGKIISLNMDEGINVEANQILGYIDTIQLHLTKLQLEANARAIGNRSQDVTKQIAATRQQIKTQKQELERTKKLISANAANQKQQDDIEAQIAILEKQLAAQQSTLEKGNKSIDEENSALSIQIEQMNDQLEKCKITSPINGTILAKYAEQGESTAIGKPLFKVADINTMILRAYITSGQLTQLHLGQKVNVYADFKEKENRIYEGTITWISDNAEFTPKTIQTRDERANLVYAVKISVPNDGLLKIGMYADIKFN